MRSSNSRRDVRSLLLGGDIEPDPRFTLANERTFLAWIRTALAVVAAAVATETLMAEQWPPAFRQPVAVLLLLAGVAISAGAAVRWLAVERALRRDRPLPLSPLVPMLALVVLAGSGSVLVLML
ncbi:DUF202 domain-containing protein [Nocardioides sp. NPDC006273]|uniref:YidH family protein n=1 Tax=Nocardioides sp. NPDC006273 TaxID=3155598 RepID=UPI0033BDA061